MSRVYSMAVHLRPAGRLPIVAAAFAVLTGLVALGATTALDDAVLSAILPLRNPTLDQVVQLVTLLGGPIVSAAIAIGLTFFLVARDPRGMYVALLFAAGIAMEYTLKQLVLQPGPPSEYVRDAVLFVSLRDLAPYTYPSGHVMRVTFLASVLVSRYPRLALPAYAVAALVALGRLYLAAGWLSDMAGGLLAGLLLAAVAELIRARAASPRRARAVLVSP